ncbi:MAG: competence protein ComEC family protein [Saprospiraceae bacterium]|nr:competence protein ComEC family protein [Saprospiraceae bacterium]
MRFHEVPFLKLFIGLVAGILIYPYFIIENILGLWLISTLFIGIFFFINRNWKLSALVFYPFFICLIVAFLFFRMASLNPTNKNSYIGNQLSAVKFQGTVLSSKSRINGGRRYVLDVSNTFNNENTTVTSSGLLLLYLSASDLPPFSSGSIVQGEIYQLLPIPNAYNPGSFNQQKYWSLKRIFHKAYGNRSNWKEIKAASGSLFYRDKAQQYISSILGKALKDSVSLGLMDALLLGNKSGLTSDIMTDFKRTGAMHILAVSGLHVGILAGIIQFILGLLPVYSKRGRIFSSGLFILFLVLFAWLTHFEPAILRAVGGSILMISARIFQKTANVWNNLFAMACFLLLLDPNFFFHIGFQLSFLAVAGIIGFYKSWVGRYTFSNKLMQYFWEMTVMGFAAQWVTLPLLLYHFQQFSWLFLITGWVAIPLSTFILAVALLYITVSGIPLLNAVIGWLLEFSVFLFRWIMSFLSDVTWAVSEGIYLPDAAIICLVIIVFLIALSIEYQKRNVFIISTCLLFTLFQVSFLYYNKEEQTYILSERGNAVLTIRKGHSFFVFSNKSIDKKRQDILYLEKWATKRHYTILPESVISFNIHNATFVLLKGEKSHDFIPFGTHWWVASSFVGPWEKWLRECPPKLLILNADLPFYFKRKLLELAGKLNIEVYDIGVSGAFNLSKN